MIYLHTHPSTPAASLLGELTLTTNPETGSVITAFEYQQHIEIECVFREGVTVINTVWRIQFASDLDNGMIVYMYIHCIYVCRHHLPIMLECFVLKKEQSQFLVFK